MLNFVSVDTETANAERSSICQISFAKVRDGAVVDEFSTLINPEQIFDEHEVRVHGITYKQVDAAPTFLHISPVIQHWLGNDVLVAHNMAFDGSALYADCKRYGIDIPATRLFCSLMCARRCLPTLPNFRLPTVSDCYGVILRQHHNATADAVACAEITIAMAHSMKVDNIESLAKATGLMLGELSNEGFVNCSVVKGQKVKPKIRFF